MKKEFVEEKLLPLLQAVDDDICEATYHIVDRHPYDLEYVLVEWCGGSTKRRRNPSPCDPGPVQH